MYKIFLIDDDDFILQAMQKHIDWAGIGIELIGTAANGTDGIAKIKEYEPDIVITDIGLPDMTGLELVSALRSTHIRTKFLLLTGFDDFAYAKQAVSLGVCEYMTKPVMPDDITAAVKRIVQSCDEERERAQQTEQMIKESRSVLTVNFIEELTIGAVPDEAAFLERCRLLEMDLAGKRFTVLVLRLNDPQRVTGEAELYSLMHRVIATVKEAVGQLGCGCYSQNFKDRKSVFLLVHDGELPKEELLELLTDLVEDFRLQHGLHISIGVGNPAESYREIADSHRQAMECLNFLFNEKSGSVLSYDDILNTQIIHSIELYDRNKLIEALKMRDIARVDAIIGEMIEKIESRSDLNAEFVKAIALEMLCAVSYTLYNIGDCSADKIATNGDWRSISDAKHLSDIVAVLQSLSDYIRQTLGIKNSARMSRIAEQMVLYGRYLLKGAGIPYLPYPKLFRQRLSKGDGKEL